MKGCGNPVIQEFRKMENRLLRLHRLALDKEHPHQPAFPERLAEDPKSEIRNEHQQHDEDAGAVIRSVENCIKGDVVITSNTGSSRGGAGG